MHKATLSRQQRQKVLLALSDTVKKRLYAPQLEAIDWESSVSSHTAKILDAGDDSSFEKAVMDLLRELKSSHVGFYRNDLKRCTAKAVLGATYSECVENGIPRWVFQNVHPGGPAAIAGIKPGDIIVSVDGEAYHPPEHPSFAVDSRSDITTEGDGGRIETKQVTIPAVKVKMSQLPKVEPNPIVSSRRIDPETGYLRIASYPGVIGVDVAKDIRDAVEELGPVQRLIVDLRGNPGGGIGVLRLMGILTPEKKLVGVNVKRKMMQNVAAVPEGAFVFDRIPESKGRLLPLIIRYLLRGRGRPIAVLTEGLGPRTFHGRIVLLADRNTSSANEMVLAFAREYELAKIVGESTPGRVLAGDKFKLPYGYTVALPVSAYQTTEGNSIEGHPIDPDIEVLFDPHKARLGLDPQLEIALETVRRL